MAQEPTVGLLVEMHREVRARMANLVRAELEGTIARWHAAGKPTGKQPRATQGDAREQEMLTGWAHFGDHLIFGGVPWEAAAVEPFYQLALDMALDAEANNPGLDLDKDTNYYMLGMAQYYQGRVEEGIHNVLCAVEEQRAAGLSDRWIVSLWSLDRRILSDIRKWLAPTSALCASNGLPAYGGTHIDTMTEEMCRDGVGAYRPEWVLRLHASLRKLQALPGHIRPALIRRFEGLQGLSFLYEGSLKQRFSVTSGTLIDVIREVCAKRPHIPRVILDRWPEFTSTGRTGRRRSAHSSADDALAALRTESFSGLTMSEVFAARAVLTTGLVRNTVLHQMDLASKVVNADYQWVCDQMLAALVLSW